MPRPERRLDPSAGPSAEFAAGLRELRRRAGSPSYRRMASTTHYAATTLSEAASGRRLPSIDVAVAYAEACGGDAAEWRRRWRIASGLAPGGAPSDLPAPSDMDALSDGPAAAAGPPAAAPTSVRDAAGPMRSASRRIRRVAVLAAVSGALIGLITASALAVGDNGGHRAGTPSGRPGPGPSPSAVRDGADPKLAGCAATASTLAATPVVGYGTVELRYAADCHAGWARYTPGPQQPRPAIVTITIDRSRPVGSASVTFEVYDGPIYSDLELFEGGCLRASASVGGVHPAVSAATTCVPEP